MRHRVNLVRGIDDLLLLPADKSWVALGRIIGRFLATVTRLVILFFRNSDAKAGVTNCDDREDLAGESIK